MKHSKSIKTIILKYKPTINIQYIYNNPKISQQIDDYFERVFKALFTISLQNVTIEDYENFDKEWTQFQQNIKKVIK